MKRRGPTGPQSAAPTAALTDEPALAALASAVLHACTPTTAKTASRLSPLSSAVTAVVAAIQAGEDPLGEAFCRLRSARNRRAHGQVFTPPLIVRHMVEEAACDGGLDGFTAVIDCGTGSGRYLREAAPRFPAARLIGVESDPLCALLARASLAAAGLAERTTIIEGDFRDVSLPDIPGRRLFIGNPPYVRHHDIAAAWKSWYAASVIAHGLPRPSKLAGLHLHFFARTAELARPGDLGIFVTAAEWLDTGYGAALRGLLLGPLGGRSITTVDATAAPFPGTLSTAAITLFAPGQPVPHIAIGETTDVETLHQAPRQTYAADDPALSLGRWSLLTRGRNAVTVPVPSGRVGDLFRVSRGQVTGCNAAFVVGSATPTLPQHFLHPCVTGADQIFAAANSHGGRLKDPATVGRVVCLPRQLDGLPAGEGRQVKAYLAWATAQGAKDSYTARHRTPWWRVAMAEPAPILMSYMARRPPAFVRNDIGAGIINVAHGLWPRLPLSSAQLDAACAALNAAVAGAVGRTYAGGLVKFEPRTVEDLPIDWTQAGLGKLLQPKEHGR